MKDDVENFAAYVRKCLDYDPDTGVLTWRRRPWWHFSTGSDRGWNKRYAGTPAGRIRHGYVVITLDGKSLFAHRLAWLIVHGHWPEVHIDHVNGVRDDNRLCNLREATHEENQRNQSLRCDNSSGYKGVRLHKCGKFVANIGHAGRKHYLGLFATAEEAYEAYCLAAKELHGEFAKI